MKGSILVLLFVLSVCAACVVTPGPPGYGGVSVVAPLPLVVELGPDPYYFYKGNYYFYDNNAWRYSKSRSGPWTDLPRTHWPKEIRHRDRDRSWDRDRDRDFDRYDRDYR